MEKNKIYAYIGKTISDIYILLIILNITKTSSCSNSFYVIHIYKLGSIAYLIHVKLFYGGMT